MIGLAQTTSTDGGAAANCRRIRWHTSRRGLTLIELLVVMVIIGMLVGLTIPAVRAARETANRTSCSNNLRQLGLALDQHHQQLASYPQDGERGWGMVVFLLPYLEEAKLYDQLAPKKIDLSTPTKARPGFEDTFIAVFGCTSAGSPKHLPDSDFARSNYLGTSDLFALRTTYEFVRDGESNTIALGETITDHAWALPRTGSGETPPNTGGDFSSRHSGGAQFVLCDTSVKFINDDIEPAVFRALCTIDGGEVIPEF